MINPATSPRFIKIEDIVKGILRRQKDLAGVDKLLLKDVAKDVYKELNLGAIKIPIRVILNVDKRTNSIYLPENYMTFSSISAQDECGIWVPMVINTNLTSDIIDISGVPDCGCECGCTSELCSSIKNYELIQEDVSVVMPDTTTQVFTATLRKKIDNNGNYVAEKIWPTQKFDNGTYVAVVMETTDEFICKVDTLPCGCIAPTITNDEIVTCNTAAISFGVDCGCHINPGDLMAHHHRDCNTYNFSQEGDRITFDDKFHHDQVLLRYYADNKTKDILVPIIARRAMVAGIKADMADYEKQMPNWKINDLKANRTKANRVLMDLLNIVNIKGFSKTVTPKRRMV
jgi:hypothetical protein